MILGAVTIYMPNQSPKRLEAPLIIASGQGHMGSETHNKPYREFNILKRLLVI